MAGGPLSSDPTIGSSGMLVAAGLETAGHYLQSQILDAIQNGLAGSLGTFFFVSSAVAAVLIIAVGGRYKFGTWFLIGPILFFAAVSWRVPSAGVKWQFGDREHDPKRLKDATVGVYGGSSAIAIAGESRRVGEVAWVFATWDRIVSGTIQSVISVLNVTDINADLDFLTKTRRYAALFNLDVADSQMQMFLQTVMVAPCARYYALQQELTDPARVVPKSEIEAELRNIENAIVVSNTDRGGELIRKMAGAGYFGASPKVPSENGYSCRQIWDLGKEAMKQYAYNEVVKVAGAGLPKDQPIDESLRVMAKKFVGASGSAVGDQAVTQMVNAIGVKMLQREMTQRSPGLAALTVTKHLPQASAGSDRAKDHYDVDSDLRMEQAPLKYKGFGEYLSFILGLPYLQGITLYSLAMSYPFFAFMLIMPGRSKEFFNWMGLWVWVKSWDIGFAVVMLIDELLYFLLPHGPALSDSQLTEPAQAFQVVYQADPVYSVTLYYMIMAALMGSIPVVMGFAVKRGGRQLMDAVMGGYSDFAGKIGGAMQSYAGSMKAQEIAANVEKAKVDAVRGKALETVINDPEIKALLTHALGAKFAGGFGKGAINEFMGAMNRVTNPYAKQLIEAKLQAAMSVESLRASTTPEADQATREGQLLGYYRHPMSDQVPNSALLGVKQARVNYKYATAAQSGVKGLVGAGFKRAAKAARSAGRVATGRRP